MRQEKLILQNLFAAPTTKRVLGRPKKDCAETEMAHTLGRCPILNTSQHCILPVWRMSRRGSSKLWKLRVCIVVEFHSTSDSTERMYFNHKHNVEARILI